VPESAVLPHEARQLFIPEELQVSVADPPGCTPGVFEVRVSVASPLGGGTSTSIVSVRVVLPPNPVHAIVYVVVAVGATVTLPLVPIALPYGESVHAVAFSVVHESVDD
jgi:hypothetical protein